MGRSLSAVALVYLTQRFANNRDRRTRALSECFHVAYIYNGRV